MDNQDKKEFHSLLTDAYSMYSKTLTKNILVIWWKALEIYRIEDVQQAFGRHVMASKFCPTPVDILEYLPDPFGHLSPEEAWNRLPKTDYDGGYVTDQMMAACAACFDSLERGDYVSARMAFIESYKKQVALAKGQQEKAKFWYSGPSMGDYAQRLMGCEAATIEAAELGWLEPKRAYKALESICSQLGKSSEIHLSRLQKLPNGQQLIGIGSNKTPDQSETISAHLRLIKTDVKELDDEEAKPQRKNS